MFTRRADKCCDGGNQHNFQPRYTEKALMNAKFSKMEGSMEQLRKLMVGKVYVHDICKWCGASSILNSSITLPTKSLQVDTILNTLP